LDGRFVFNVKACSCLIEQYYRRILEEGARYGYALTFSAGQLAAVLANIRVPLIRQLFDKLSNVCKARRRHDLLVACVLFADADILHNSVVKKRYILKHNGIKAHERFGVYL